MKKGYLFIVFMLFCALSYSYMETDTKYFKIIYSEDMEESAAELIEIVDDIAEREYKFYNFDSSIKITVVLTDKVDYANAFSKLDKVIVLYPNDLDSFYTEKNYSNWLGYVFSHELTHAIISNKNEMIKYTQGVGAYIHNFFTPIWFHEGMAVYSETRFGNGGRGISPRFDMALKAELMEGDFKGLSLAGNYEYKGNYPYLYGYSFISWFSSKFGETRLQEAFEKFSYDQILSPLSTFSKVVKVGENELIAQWKSDISKKYSVPINVVEGKTIFAKEGRLRNLTLDSGKLWFYYEGEHDTGIYEKNENEPTLKIKGGIGNGFDVVDGEVFYSKLSDDYIKGRTEAFAYKNNENIQEKRVVGFARTSKGIAYIHLQKGKQELKLSDGTVIIESNKEFLFEKFTEYNGKLYFSAGKKKEIGNYIYEYNWETKQIKKIVQGYSPFVYGNFIYFSNDRNGTYNIFSMDINTLEIKQITDVKYGAFEPIILNGTLYFLNYTKNGETINKLEEKEFLNKKIEAVSLVEDIKAEIKNENATLTLNSKKYKGDMRLVSWYFLPLGIDNIEGEMTFNDAIGAKDARLGMYASATDKGVDATVYGEIGYNILDNRILTIFANSNLYIYGDLKLPLYVPSIKSYITTNISGESGNYTDDNDLDYNEKNISASVGIYGENNFGYGINVTTDEYKLSTGNNNITYIKNTLFYRNENYNINYTWSEDQFSVLKYLYDYNRVNYIYNSKSSASITEYEKIKYAEIWGKQILSVTQDYKSDWKIGIGTNDGRNYIKSNYLGLKNFYFMNVEEKEHFLIVNPYYSIGGYINYFIPLSFDCGALFYYDVSNNIKNLANKVYVSVGFGM